MLEASLVSVECLNDHGALTTAHGRFHLHPDWTPQIKPGGFVLNLNNKTRINLDSTLTNLSLELMSGEVSPQYSHILPTKVCRISGDVEVPCTVEWQLHPD